MPKKIIKVAKSKARAASERIASQIEGTELQSKAVDRYSAKRDQVVDSRIADVARTTTNRARDKFVEVTSDLVDGDFGQRVESRFATATNTARPIADASRRRLEIGSDLWGELNSSPLIVGAKRQTDSAKARIGAKIGNRTSEIAAVALTLNAVIDNLAGAEIAGDLMPKFRAAGIRGEWRTPAEARAFFDSSVPDSIQMLGEDAVREFLADKDLSHIESFKNNPSRGSDPTNVIWEAASANRSRGADDMTWLELAQVRFSNGWGGFSIAAAEIVPRSMFYAAAIEAAISITENSIYVYRGGKDVPTALRDTAINVTKSAGMGLIIGTGIAALSAVGAAPAIVAIAPALGVIGGGLLIYSASRRIHTALTTPIYSEGAVIESQIVRCCIDDDQRVPANQLAEMLIDAKPNLTNVSQAA